MRSFFISIFFIAFLAPGISFGQYQESHQVYFSTRVHNPVTLEVTDQDRSTVIFNVENNSWFPYQLEIKFDVLLNLSPPMSTHKEVVLPGKRVLLRFKVKDPKSPHRCIYSYQYRIGDPHKKTVLDYPYVMPLSEGARIHCLQVSKGDSTLYFKNAFHIEKGDTVFCMRKGVVTSVKTSGDLFDRVDRNSSVEVLHTDGTVATYTFLASQKIGVVPGQAVYPLEPLEVALEPGILTVQVFSLENQEDSRIESFHFRFEGDGVSPDHFLNGSVVKHDLSLVPSELSGKEKKKWKKGRLYD